jgi:EmrB/QacA subfamily drug resistance transporter
VAGSSAAASESFDVRRIMLSLVGILLSILLAALEQTVVGTALPRVVADLGGFEHYSWVFSAYLFASTAITPVAGKLSDLFGRKRLIAVGIIGFLVGSALCGAAATMLQLVLFRALQGLGAGVLTAAAFAAIGDLFPPAERGKYQGLVVGVFGLASLFGPTLGGYLTDTVGWRWVFWLNLPVGGVALAVLLATFPAHAAPKREHRIDYLGAVLVTGATLPLLLALVWAGTLFPWASPQILGLLALAAVLFGLFAWVERRASEPIMPPEVFQDRIIVVGLVVVTLAGVAMYGLIVYLPLFVQGVLGLSATEAGAVMTPLTLAVVVSNITSGQLIARTGRYRRIALGGLALLAVGVGLLTFMNAATSSATMLFNEIVAGLGLGFIFPVFTIALQNTAPHSRLGVVTSALQFCRSIGATLGVALMGSLLTSRFTAEMVQRLPPGLEGQLGDSLWADLLNPQMLMRPGEADAVRATFVSLGPPASRVADSIVAIQREALGLALHDAFLLLVGVTVVAFATTLLLREIPLRRSHEPHPLARPAEAES